MSKQPLIVVSNVTQEFKVGEQTVQPIHDVNFSIEPNSFNIIYGPSGSGKSTLLNILTGLQSPTKGTVSIEGHDVYKLERAALANFRAKQLGFVYQTNFWIQSLNVVDNVAMSLYFAGMGMRKARRLAHESLKMVHMEAYANKYPTLLSGGEQQRIAMARALATNPLFLIADEPTGNLDSENGDMIMDLLRRCQTEFGRTVILVTHNMEYLSLADQLLHIENGQIRQMHDSTIDEVTDALMKETIDRIKYFAEIKDHDK